MRTITTKDVVNSILGNIPSDCKGNVYDREFCNLHEYLIEQAEYTAERSKISFDKAMEVVFAEDNCKKHTDEYIRLYVEPIIDILGDTVKGKDKHQIYDIIMDVYYSMLEPC